MKTDRTGVWMNALTLRMRAAIVVLCAALALMAMPVPALALNYITVNSNITMENTLCEFSKLSR